MPSPPSPRSALLLALVAAAGVVVTGSLSLEHLRLAGERGAFQVCGRFGPGCSGALASADAYLGGVPVAFLGLGWWSGLLLLVILSLSSERRCGGWSAAPWPQLLAAAGAVALLPAGWFTFRLLAASGRLGESLRGEASYPLCAFCLTSHALTLLFFLVAVAAQWMAARAEPGATGEPAGEQAAGVMTESPWSSNPLPRVALVAALLLGVAVAGGLTWRTTVLELRMRTGIIERLRSLPGAAPLIAVNSLSALSAESLAAAVAELPPPSLGPVAADAAVTIRDFVDMNCSHCYDSIDRVRAIVAEFEGEVRFELFHFPGNSECNAHYRFGGLPHSCEMARAAIAAYVAPGDPAERNARYWRMVDAMIRRYRERQQGLADLPAMAESIGLPREEFANALAGEALAVHLRRDTDLGARIPIRAFPTLLVDERVLERDASLDDLRAVVREALARRAAAAGFPAPAPPAQ